MSDFSDYIVFVDESGDHSLTSIDVQFPIFALSFCIFKKSDYANVVVPAVQTFKFKYWGHDAVVLHEHEIRKSKGDFSLLLTDRTLRSGFYEDLQKIMRDTPMAIIGAVIDKDRLIEKYASPWNPYQIALHFCLERLHEFLRTKAQHGRRTHIVFECRGKSEDAELELTFRRIVSSEGQWGYRRHDFSDMDLEPKFARKSVNSTGLQIADLTARPIGLRALRPGQQNRTYEIIDDKLFALKIFP